MIANNAQPDTQAQPFGEFKAAGLRSYGAEPKPDAQARAESAGQAPPAIGEIRRRSTRRTVEARRVARLAREANAAEVIGQLPDAGQDVVLILDGTFHGWDILSAILTLAGEAVTVTEAYITTLGFNRAQTDHLADLLDAGKIDNLTFVVSEMFTQKNAGEYEYLSNILTTRGQKIYSNRNHAKLMLLRFSDGRHIVTHGSLNLRRCNDFEQLAITQDADLYQFFVKFVEDVVAGSFQP